MSGRIRDDDSIAEKLEHTKWDYSQRQDRSFLLEPIGSIFSTFCWDGKPERVIPVKREPEDEITKG